MMSEVNAGGDGSGQVKYNQKNAGVKRILQEVKDMQADPSPDFIALPLEDNIFEWQFAIRGPRDSEFEGGIYHGRIQLPPEYPFKPPAFMLLTPNGRFETQTKICLSISNYHPEHWLPSWSIRTALVALIAFMPTNPDGALGSLDYKKDERRALAIKSRESPPTYGNADRQRLMDEIHQYMLSKAPSVPELPAESNTNQSTTAMTGARSGPNDITTAAVEELANPEAEQMIVEDRRELHLNAAAGPVRVRFSAGVSLQRTQAVETNQQNHRPIARAHKPMDDRLLTWTAVGLTVAIVALLLKKCLKSYGIEV